MRDPLKCFTVVSQSRTLFRGSERTGGALAFTQERREGGGSPATQARGGGSPATQARGGGCCGKNEGLLLQKYFVPGKTRFT
jgi:hypothetical protein